MPSQSNFLLDMLTGQADMREALDMFDSLIYVSLLMWMHGAFLQVILGNAVLIKCS